MTRKPLTASATVIADTIRRKAVEQTDLAAAEAIGVDASTICRFKTDHLEKFCAYLDFLGLTVIPNGLRTIKEDDLQALKRFAHLGLEAFGSDVPDNGQ